MKYLPYVNVKMGTRSVPRFSTGNTLPLTQRPFGMAPFCLQTDGGSPWFFHPDRPYAEGVRLTHRPSPWIRDHGTFLMMPQNDVVADTPSGAWSGYRIRDAVMRPDYLRVRFLRSETLFELTPTMHGAAIRLTFENDRASFLSLFTVLGNSTFRFDRESNTLFASTDGYGAAAENFHMYCAIRFLDDCVDADATRVARKDETALSVHVALTRRTVHARLGISYISEDLACAAIDRECGDRDFDTLRAEAEEEWEDKLHRIEIEPEGEEQARTFYSCLYRVFLYPNCAWEYRRDGKKVHYSPYTGGVLPGPRYLGNGFWDTYRTVYPLFALIARDEYADMLEGFVNDYRESGWLPRWIALGEVGCMPSTLIDAVIADAAVKGIGDRALLETALEGMLHHANTEAPEKRFGRNGVASYVKYGYVPLDEEKESVNLTLDAAYGDWCIATVAGVLGREDLVDEYLRRAKNYRNLFDPATGFMRGKDKNGEHSGFFDPISWGGEYTEGSAWQSSFAVPHDVEGLAALYGGRDRMLAKLDELFATPPRYRVRGYRNEIHEMTEMAAADFGQCAISNQPSFHLPFLFAVLGAQEKTDFWVEKLAREAFFPGDDGYPGDEDNGSMSAWYIFACLGMYPLCPGKNEMVRSRRLVRAAKLLGKPLD